MKKTESQKIDESFMEQALEFAQLAFKKGEVPIGALIVSSEGIVVGSGYNRVEEEKTQTAHAEMEALKNATKKINDWRLSECTLYVTLEPCSMCMAALGLSRIKRVVFGGYSPLFGFLKEHLLCELSKVAITGGIKESECTALLNSFFKQARKI